MRVWLQLALVVSCGTAPSPEEAPRSENIPAAESPAQRELSEQGVESNVESNEESNGEVAEAEPEVAPMVGPRNFVTPHHCHPPGPCTFEFESLRGIQHIDVGHGHASAPALQATLRLREGEARVESLFADSENPGEGRILGRERDSLEGGAYYISVSGTASRVELEILFEP